MSKQPPTIKYIGILRSDFEPSEKTPFYELVAEFNSGAGLIYRGLANGILTFAAKFLAERTESGQRRTIDYEGNITHAYRRNEGITGIVVTDQKYPDLVAQQLLSKICDEFLSQFPRAKWPGVDPSTVGQPKIAPKAAFQLSFPALKEYMNKYMDPKEVDSIAKIQSELDETQQVLRKTIDSVLQRGEKLDTLIDKSNDLSASSKMFAKSAKAQNSCCILM